MPAQRPAAHSRVDAAFSVPGGLAVRAGVFRPAATQWREEPFYQGLKVIFVDGRVDSRIEDAPLLRLSGPALCLVWSARPVWGADAFSEGVDQRYAMVTLPAASMWTELGVEPGMLARLGRPAGAEGPALWYGPAGPEARRVADQLRVCAYQGAARSLYLAAKGLELAALALAQVQAGREAPPAPAGMAARERDAAHEARRCLLSDLRQPPSAAELARSLGLHTRRLDEAYRREFGVSMARSLQEARLLRARELILNGGLSVSEAAWHVGYGPAHFSVAFKRRFGASPSAYC